jgi:UrcA family protein
MSELDTEEGIVSNYQIHGRSLATVLAAGFLTSVMATAAVSTAHANPRNEVVVTAPKLTEDTLVAYVFYSDLNINAEAGMARLNARVSGAVKQVCPIGDHLNLKESAHNRQCRQDAFSQASRQIERIKSEQFASKSGSISIAARR